MGLGRLYSPATHKDLTSYCAPQWISDYHFTKAFTFRLASSPAAFARPLAASRTTTLLLWWRGAGDGGLGLEPAFELEHDGERRAPRGPCGRYRAPGRATVRALSVRARRPWSSDRLVDGGRGRRRLGATPPLAPEGARCPSRRCPADTTRGGRPVFADRTGSRRSRALLPVLCHCGVHRCGSGPGPGVRRPVQPGDTERGERIALNSAVGANRPPLQTRAHRPSRGSPQAQHLSKAPHGQHLLRHSLPPSVKGPG